MIRRRPQQIQVSKPLLIFLFIYFREALSLSTQNGRAKSFAFHRTYGPNPFQDSYRIHHYQRSSLRAEGGFIGKSLLDVLNDEVSELILDKLYQKRNANNNVKENKSSRQQKKSGRFQPSADGLSKFHRSILASTAQRQRCVTGEYPLRITIEENPTRKWLSSGSASSQMLVNGTSVDRSLASFDRFQWLDEDEQERLHNDNALVSLELLAEINVRKPGYVNILRTSPKNNDRVEWKSRWKYPQSNNEKEHEISLDESLELEKERLWITGFSLTKPNGELHSVDVEDGVMGQVNARTSNAIRWPNEVNHVLFDTNVTDLDRKESINSDALLVSDGFLVPGKDNGGVYVVTKPGHDSLEWNACLAGGNGVDGLLSKLEKAKSSTIKIDGTREEGWFYHRSIWIDLTGDGRKSILTSRAKRPKILNKGDAKVPSNEEGMSGAISTEAQLVWLERPKPFCYDQSSGTPLDKDGLVFDPFSPKHTPWKLRVLDKGPDVMFSVADLDTKDDTVEVFASQFFSQKLTLHSIQKGPEPKVVFRRTIDDQCGASFSSILADLRFSHEENQTGTRRVVDCGSTVTTLKEGDYFSHLLVTSHECQFSDEEKERDHVDGPFIGGAHEDLSETKNIHTNGTPVQAIDGGSLFSYRVPEGKDAWKTKPWLRSVIATGFRVKGQLGNFINPGAPGFCYTFYAKKDGSQKRGFRPLIGIAGDCAESAYILRPVDSNEGDDPSANYTMMCEIECGATVGSIGVGYEDFCFAPQQNGFAKIYIPCYEKDKVLVFAMGSGDDDDGWS